MKFRLVYIFLLIFILLTVLPSVPDVKAEDQPQTTPSTVGTYTMNWPSFWQTFKTFSAWLTEWDSGTGWVNRDACMQIIRDYPEPNHVKITLNFTSQEQGNYRFTFAIDKRVKDYVEKISVWRYELTYEGFTVVFDWSDMKDIPNLIVTHGVQDGYFWFRIRKDNIPENFNYIIDPSVVGTADWDDATEYSYQRKVFYMQGLFWVFYYDGTNLVYRTSGDGESWGSSTTVRASVTGNDFSLYFDGDNIQYVFSPSGGGNLTYRVGTPQTTGSITWLSSEQQVTDDDSGNDPYIACDTSGYPFIAYRNSTLTHYPYVTKSSTKNGSWTTDAGFPYQLSTLDDTDWKISLVPLSSNKIYAIYGWGIDFNGSLYDGLWGANEQVSTISDGYFPSYSSAVSTGTVIHFTYVQATPTANIKYQNYTIASGWTAEINATTGLSGTVTGCPLSYHSENDTLYLFYGIADTIYYKRFNGTWSSATTWFTDSNINEKSLTSSLESNSGYVGLAYVNGTGSPYDVKFNYLDFWTYRYKYNLYGVYDEDTGLFNPIGCNVTAYYIDGTVTETFLVNGSYLYESESLLQYFNFNLTNTRQYWLGSTETSGDIHIFEVFDDSTTVYTIAFLDLAGALEDYPFVEAQRYVNGTLYTVEKRKVDVDKKIVMALKNGEKYTIVIQDGSSYTFGDLLMTSTTTITLTLKGVDFPKETLLTYKYVRIYGTRAWGVAGTGNITITYQDTLELTTSVKIDINYKNGTNAYTHTETDDSFNHVWASALNNTDYAVVCTITHERYGSYSWKQYFPRTFSDAPWGLDWLGTSLPFATSTIIPMFLILFVAGCFSQINAEVGAFSAVVTALILTYMGWINIPAGALVTAFSLVILMAIIYSKRRVQVY